MKAEVKEMLKEREKFAQYDKDISTSLGYANNPELYDRIVKIILTGGNDRGEEEEASENQKRLARKLKKMYDNIQPKNCSKSQEYAYFSMNKVTSRLMDFKESLVASIRKQTAARMKELKKLAARRVYPQAKQSRAGSPGKGPDRSAEKRGVRSGAVEKEGATGENAGFGAGRGAETVRSDTETPDKSSLGIDQISSLRQIGSFKNMEAIDSKQFIESAISQQKEEIQINEISIQDYDWNSNVIPERSKEESRTDFIDNLPPIDLNKVRGSRSSLSNADPPQDPHSFEKQDSIDNQKSQANKNAPLMTNRGILKQSSAQTGSVASRQMLLSKLENRLRSSRVDECSMTKRGLSSRKESTERYTLSIRGDRSQRAAVNHSLDATKECKQGMLSKFKEKSTSRVGEGYNSQRLTSGQYGEGRAGEGLTRGNEMRISQFMRSTSRKETTDFDQRREGVTNPISVRDSEGPRLSTSRRMDKTTFDGKTERSNYSYRERSFQLKSGQSSSRIIESKVGQAKIELRLEVL